MQNIQLTNEEFEEIIIINGELSWIDAIKKKTKEEMLGICEVIKAPYKKSWVKDKLANSIKDKITEHPETILYLFRKEYIDILLEMYSVKEKTAIKVPLDIVVEYFMDLGLVRENFIVEEDSIINCYEVVAEAKLVLYNYFRGKEGRQFIKRMNEFDKVTTGQLYYYGIIEANELYQMYLEISPEKISYDEYYDRIKMKAFYWDELYIIENSNIDYIMTTDILDVDEILEKRKGYKNLEYKKYTKAEFIKMEELEGIEELPIINEFLEYLIIGLGIDLYDASVIMESTIVSLRNGITVDSLVGLFMQSEGCKALIHFDKKKFEEYLTILEGVTTSYLLKGHTPNELKQPILINKQPQNMASNLGDQRSIMNASIVDLANQSNGGLQVKQKKIGRNEPCPCGSGKKYKHCCGR